jgi:hypothetical protein
MIFLISILIYVIHVKKNKFQQHHSEGVSRALSEEINGAKAQYPTTPQA